jgi:hypothetical protein
MNLFYLDVDHDVNAEYHIDKHVIKMILEAAEMLCMAHVVKETVGFIPRALEKDEYRACVEYKKEFKPLLPIDRPIPYMGRDSHLNHPSTIWVRSSLSNYEWTWCYMHSLELERRYRNPKGKAIHEAYRLCIEKLPDLDIPDVGMTKFALAMKSMIAQYPDYVFEDNPIESYRNFYMADKSTFASWKSRQPPWWWNQEWADSHALR